MTQQDPNVPDSIVVGQFSGLKNTVAPERLAPTELERAININIDDAGQVHRRRGYTLKDTAAWHSVETVGDRVFGVRNGSFGIVNADYSFTALQGAGVGALCYTEVNGEAFFSGSISGVVAEDNTISPWGASDGQGMWLSPVMSPTDTLGPVSGRMLTDPPIATSIEAYSGRIYLAYRKTLWATELFAYHYVDRTRNFMQFEHNITLLMAMDNGIYVGTEGGLYFIHGTLGTFKLSLVSAAAVLPGSGTRAPVDLVHPQARAGPVPSGDAAIMMTSEGILAGFDGGTAFNLTQGTMVFPRGVSAAALFRQEDGVSSYVAAVDSAGAPTAAARIGDFVDAEIVRFGG